MSALRTFASTPPPHATQGDKPADAPVGRTIALLTVTGILVVGQTYTLLPLLDAVGRTFNTPAGALTWMITAFGLAYAAGFLLAGPLSDRYGPRRVITAGLLVTALTTAAVATASSLTAGIVLRAVQGLSAAAFAPAAFSYIAERIPMQRRALALSCLTSGFLAAAVLMQVAGQALAAVAGWQAVFLASAPCLLAAAAASWTVLRPEDGRGRPAPAGAVFAAMPRLLTRPRLLALYGATTTVLGGFVALYTAISLAGPPRLVGHPQALILLRASALPAVVAIPLITPLVTRVPLPIRIAGGLAIAALCALGASVLAGCTVALAAVLLVFVAGIAVAAPALVEDIGASAGDARGAAVALYAFATFLGASLGPQFAKALTGLGFTGIAAAVAAVLGVGAVLGLLGSRHGPSSEAPRPDTHKES